VTGEDGARHLRGMDEGCSEHLRNGAPTYPEAAVMVGWDGKS